jgi:hypothetical protein
MSAPLAFLVEHGLKRWPNACTHQEFFFCFLFLAIPHPLSILYGSV